MIGKEFDVTRRRVLFTIVVIGLASAAAGAGTTAYFSDTETSADNNVTAGTLDLGATSTTNLAITDAVPGDAVSGTVTSDYSGSAGAEIDIDVLLTEPSEPNEPASNTNDLTAAQFASNLNVTSASADVNGTSESLVTSGMDADSDGNVTLDEFESAAPFDAVTGTNATDGETVTFGIDLTFMPEAGNDAQADGVDVTVSLTAEQPGAD